MKNQNGISMLEILLVLAIFSVIFSISTFGYVNWRKDVLLVNNKEELKSTLLKAQQLATAAADNNSWGVHLETDRFTLFKGSFFNEEDQDNKIKILSGVEIFHPTSSLADGAGGYSPNVVFTKFFGETANTGTIYFIIPNNSSTQTFINIRSSGQVD